jgi:hypothetical protein
MALDFSALQAEITRDADVNSSAATLLADLAARVEATKGDPAAVQALADSLRANSDALAAAVVANTPADPSARKR